MGQNAEIEQDNNASRGELRVRVDRTFLGELDQLRRHYGRIEGKPLDHSAALRRVVLDSNASVGVHDAGIKVPIGEGKGSRLYYLYAARERLKEMKRELAEVMGINDAVGVSEAEVLRLLVRMAAVRIKEEANDGGHY